MPERLSPSATVCVLSPERGCAPLALAAAGGTNVGDGSGVSVGMPGFWVGGAVGLPTGVITSAGAGEVGGGLGIREVTGGELSSLWVWRPSARA